MVSITVKTAEFKMAPTTTAAWDKADAAVGRAFSRYNATVSGEIFGDLYGRAYNPATDNFDGEFILLTYPVRYGRVIYYITEHFPAVYKYDKRTGKYRESKTAYKKLQACERAIERAIDRRERC